MDLVTSELFIGIELAPLGDLYLTRQRLLQKGVTFITDVVIDEIQGTLVKAHDLYTDRPLIYQDYDTVILDVPQRAEVNLYRQLKGQVQELYRIGDCLAPRTIEMAIFEGWTDRGESLMEYRYLFSPLKIGSVIVPNRINFGAHLTNLSEGHKISEDQIYYYRERARGGCGLITTEELSVHPSDLAYEKLVDAYDPQVIAGFQRLTRVIHRYDTRIFAQLNHNGLQADGKNSRRPVWGPSAGKDPIFRETCQAMEIEDIRECVDYFAGSAIHAVEGGFDGIELQLGHSSLIRQFLSPATNRREDEYGGPFENRLRFALEVIEAVRRAVGPDFHRRDPFERR